MSKFIVITGVLLSTIHYANSQNRLVTYPAPEGADLMNDFTVKVRETGKDWKPVDTYLVKVDEVRNIKHHVERASMSYFDVFRLRSRYQLLSITERFKVAEYVLSPMESLLQ